MMGLYLHIPFCKNVCHYCDFYKMVVSNEYQENVIKYLEKEMVLRKIDKIKFDTLYIGGGTPSALCDELFEKLLKIISSYIETSKLKEFTIEFNPNDISESKVNLLKKYHVSRVSIGIQSFNQNTLSKLGRIPYVSFEEMRQKIICLKNAGINNINVDLIYGVYGETLENLKEDLELFIKLDVSHISTYSLILEEKTILNYKVQKEKIALLDEEVDAKMYHLIVDTLKMHNFIHYETSNFAKEGYYSKHNLIYWHYDNYLGIGPSASSHLDNIRFTNAKVLKDYFKGLDEATFSYFEYLEEDEKTMMENFVMLGLRLIDGFSIEDFEKKFKKDLLFIFPNIKKLINDGLLEKDHHLKIPKKFTYIANFIISQIF